MAKRGEGNMAATGGVLGRTVPAARVEGLVVTEARDEVLVYDTERHHIHHLNAVTAAIWRSLDGARSTTDVAHRAGQVLGADLDEATVRMALTTLADAELLDGELAASDRVAGQSRRRFLKKAAIAGAAVPIIASVTAPAASAQNSCAGGSGRPAGCACGNSQQCASSSCVGGTCQ